MTARSRTTLATAVGCATALFQTITHAEVDEPWALATLKENACLTCHYVNEHKFGPSFRAVSKKYEDKTVDDILVTWANYRVHSGVRTQIRDQDLRSVLEWVLTLRTSNAARDRK